MPFRKTKCHSVRPRPYSGGPTDPIQKDLNPILGDQILFRKRYILFSMTKSQSGRPRYHSRRLRSHSDRHKSHSGRSKSHSGRLYHIQEDRIPFWSTIGWTHNARYLQQPPYLVLFCGADLSLGERWVKGESALGRERERERSNIQGKQKQKKIEGKN